MPRRLEEPKHTCHAFGCKTEVAPALFMCRKHWRMVPRDMQRRLWAVYVPGQEVSKTPSREYLSTSMEIMRYVRELEKADA